MEMQYKDRSEISDSIGLLVSILVCYPGICSVKFDPKSQTLQFSFLLKEVISIKRFTSFKTKMRTCLDIYGEWNRKSPPFLEIRKQDFEGLSLLEINCGIDTLTREEITLVNELIRQEFEGTLITEQRDQLVEEELVFQEALIENMLESMRDSVPERSLIGFREEGKVMVFNK